MVLAIRLARGKETTMKPKAGIVSIVLCMAVALAFGLSGVQAFAVETAEELAASATNMQAQEAQWL